MAHHLATSDKCGGRGTRFEMKCGAPESHCLDTGPMEEPNNLLPGSQDRHTVQLTASRRQKAAQRKTQEEEDCSELQKREPAGPVR